MDVFGKGPWVESTFAITGVYENFPTVYSEDKLTIIAKRLSKTIKLMDV